MTNPRNDDNPAHDLYAPAQEQTMTYTTGSFTRDPDHKMVAGLCSAIAQRTGWDVNLLRLGLVVGTIITGSTLLWVYLAAWAIIPARGAETTAFNEAVKEGQKFYESQKAKKRPSAQPGPAPQTPPAARTDAADPYNLYRD